MMEEDKDFDAFVANARLSLIENGRIPPKTPEERKAWLKFNGRPYGGPQDLKL